jgi:hypothetical protein
MAQNKHYTSPTVSLTFPGIVSRGETETQFKEEFKKDPQKETVIVDLATLPVSHFSLLTITSK